MVLAPLSGRTFQYLPKQTSFLGQVRFKGQPPEKQEIAPDTKTSPSNGLTYGLKALFALPVLVGLFFSAIVLPEIRRDKINKGEIPAVVIDNTYSKATDKALELCLIYTHQLEILPAQDAQTSAAPLEKRNIPNWTTVYITITPIKKGSKDDKTLKNFSEKALRKKAVDFFKKQVRPKIDELTQFKGPISVQDAQERYWARLGKTFDTKEVLGRFTLNDQQFEIQLQGYGRQTPGDVQDWTVDTDLK